MANNDSSENKSRDTMNGTNGNGNTTKSSSPPHLLVKGLTPSPTSSNVPPILLQAQELLEKNGIPKFEPIMEKTIDPGQAGSALQLQTNAFGIVLSEEKHTVYMFDVTITAEVAGKVVDVTKKGRDEYVVIVYSTRCYSCLVNDHKEKCMTILDKLIETNPDVFPDKYGVYYDGQAIMYSLHNFLKVKVMELSGYQFEGDLARFSQIKCEFKKPAQRPSFVFNRDAQMEGTADLNIKSQNRHHHQFMEIVLNQYALHNLNQIKVYEHGKTFLVNPGGIEMSVGDGKVIKSGAKKSVRQVQGPMLAGFNNPAVIVDAMSVPFHMEQNLAAKALAIAPGCLGKTNPSDRSKIERVVKGLFVETIHGKKRRMQIHGISQNSADSCYFERDNGNISVAAYFQEVYNTIIQHPRAPMALCREKGRLNSYPLEVLKVLPMQRVTIPQQTPEQSANSTRLCAVDPPTRQMLIMKNANALKINDNHNPYLCNIGVSLKEVPFMIPGRQLPTPEIQFSRLVNAVGGRWSARDCKFLKPTTISKWQLLCFQDENVTQYTGIQMQKFAEAYMNEGMKRGIKFQTKLPEFAFVNENGMKDAIRAAANNNCIFVLCIIADKFELHHKLKLYEREFNIITQQVNMSSVTKIMCDHKFLTLENIIKKTNVKNGGLNYTLGLTKLNGASKNWFSATRLYLGIWVNMPPRAVIAEDRYLSPMVVGYAANMSSIRDEIVGDFTLQNNDHDTFLDTLKTIIIDCTARHEEYGNALQELVIYRSNTDEGSYGTILTREIPVIKAALIEAKKPDVKLIYILVSKEHNVRLMKDVIPNTTKPSEMNIGPGIVADVGIVSPAYKEFYLNSHTTLQGTALTPRYTVLLDECKTPMDSLEGFTWTLTHLHQIVDLTVSLPAPLYIARCYSDRGRNLYNEKDDVSKEDKNPNFKMHSDLMSFKTSVALKNKRVNA